MWRFVAATTRPLASRTVPAETPAQDAESPPPGPVPAGGTIAAGHDAFSPAIRERAVVRRVQRGVVTPAARIDLHGFTLAEAHSALVGFLTASVSRHRACVLVITGKGGATGERRAGALRREVPLWFETPVLARLVAGWSVAGCRHGGEGALYVFLRLPAQVSR